MHFEIEFALWIKSLNRNSLRILTEVDVPADYQPALNRNSPERDLALKKTQMQSLRTHFQELRELIESAQFQNE